MSNGTPKPRIEVQRETKVLNPHSDAEQVGAQLGLEGIGRSLRAPGFEYRGSIGAHLFESAITRQIEVQVQTHLPLELDAYGAYQGVTEQMAILTVQEIERVVRAVFRSKK